MAQPIYQMFLAKNTEAWYQLSQEEKDNIYNKVLASLNEVGAEAIVLCDASWSSEPWQYFGLIKFPNIEAVQKHREDTNKLEWSRYTEAMSVLGTELQMSS
jgi:hypothetical protein